MPLLGHHPSRKEKRRLSQCLSQAGYESEPQAVARDTQRATVGLRRLPCKLSLRRGDAGDEVSEDKETSLRIVAALNAARFTHLSRLCLPPMQRRMPLPTTEFLSHAFASGGLRSQHTHALDCRRGQGKIRRPVLSVPGMPRQCQYYATLLAAAGSVEAGLVLGGAPGLMSIVLVALTALVGFLIMTCSTPLSKCASTAPSSGSKGRSMDL